MKPTFKIYARHFASNNWWPLTCFFSTQEEGEEAVLDLYQQDEMNDERGIYTYQLRQDGYSC